MKRIWAPWRLRYITGPKPEQCIFCQIAADNADVQNYVLLRGQGCYIVMNLYPYTNGHLLVIPYLHTDTPLALDPGVLAELMTLTNLSIAALAECMRPDGYNVGMNLGKAAGAGIKEHLHMHIVPRWAGDNNFMPVLAETRVINQSLEDTYLQLRPVFERYVQQNDSSSN